MKRGLMGFKVLNADKILGKPAPKFLYQSENRCMINMITFTFMGLNSAIPPGFGGA